jgi:hypothetical protein
MKYAAISAILIIALAQSAITSWGFAYADTYREQCRDTGNRCPEGLKALVQVENK